MVLDESLHGLTDRMASLERTVDDRLGRLERLIEELGAGRIDHASGASPGRPAAALPPALPPPPPALPPPSPSPAAVPAAHAPAEALVLAAPVPAPDGSRDTPPIRELDLEAVLRWVGIALVLLASLFLVRTAITRGWLSPELQLLGAAVIGGGLLAAAFPLVRRRRPWALTLAIGGVAVLTVCAGAGHRWLGLYGPSTGLVLVSVAVTLAVVAAGRLGLEPVALAATAAMLIVPTWASIVTGAPELRIGTWLALFALAVNAVGLGWGWVVYRLTSTWAVAIWVAGLAASLAADGDTGYGVAGVALVALVGALLWFGPALVDRVSADGTVLSERLRAAEAWSPALVPLWAWGAVLAFTGLAVDGTGGALGLGAASGFLVLAGLGRPLAGRFGIDVVAAQVVGGGALAATASVAWLDGPALLPVGALLSLILLALGRRLGPLVKAEAVTVGAMTAVAAVGGMIEVAADGGTTGRHLAHLSVVVALCLVAAAVRTRGPEDLADPLLGAAWTGALGWVGSALAQAPQGQVAISAVWAAAAGAALVVGVRRDRGVVRTIGLVTLAVVLLKLLTVDLATVDPLWRVGLFLVVGLGLLRLGYVLPGLAAKSRSSSDGSADGRSDEPSATKAEGGGPQGEMGALPGSGDEQGDRY